MLSQDDIQRWAVEDHRKKVDALLDRKDYSAAAAAEAEFVRHAAASSGAAAAEAEFASRGAASAMASVAKAAQEEAQRRAEDDHAQRIAALLSAKDYNGAAAAEAEFARRADFERRATHRSTAERNTARMSQA